jgi:Glutathione S-transferase, N-terminal domain
MMSTSRKVEGFPRHQEVANRRHYGNRLYYAPITCALAPYITLTEAGAKFEVRPLNFKKGEHTSPEYLKVNPKHKVPLVIVDGKGLSESVAIQIWIARTFPQAKLLPADPWQELQAVSLMSWCSGGIHPLLARINSPPRVCDVPGTEESVKKLASTNLLTSSVSALRTDTTLAGSRAAPGWTPELGPPLPRRKKRIFYCNVYCC